MYYAWKFDRHEIAANTTSAVQQLLTGYRVVDGEKYFLRPVCHNSVEECECPDLDKLIEKADFHIAMIGRLNKPFVRIVMHDFLAFVHLHPDKQFQFVFLGGSVDSKDVEDMQSLSTNNLKITVTGMIYPIPLHLIKKMNF